MYSSFPVRLWPIWSFSSVHILTLLMRRILIILFVNPIYTSAMILCAIPAAHIRTELYSCDIELYENGADGFLVLKA